MAMNQPFDHSPKKAHREKSKPSANEKLMDYLARRNHSELELRQKLLKTFSQEEVERALQIARENRWLLPDTELSAQVANELHRKNKGLRFINQFLKTKGLPPVQKDSQEELRKAQSILKAKLAKFQSFDYEVKKRAQRLLANRGFDEETIRAAILAEAATWSSSANAKSEDGWSDEP